MLLTLTCIAAKAQYTPWNEVKTDKMYVIRNAYGMVNSSAQYNWYMYGGDGATNVTGVAPDAFDQSDMGFYWQFEDASAETGKAQSYYMRNVKTGTYVYFSSITTLNTKAELSSTQKTPVYLFEGGMATAATPQQGATFISLNGIGTDTQDARGFHGGGMIVWEYAGGGNQWLMTQYDLPSYYIKSATGKYMTETADGSDISMNAEASDAAKWKLTGGDTDYDYTFTSPSGNFVIGTKTVSTGDATVFDVRRTAVADSSYTLKFDQSGSPLYLKAGDATLTTDASADAAGESGHWYFISPTTGKKALLSTSADLTGSYKVKYSMYDTDGNKTEDITTFAVNKAEGTVTITNLCPALKGETVVGKYLSRKGIIIIPSGTLSSGNKAVSGVDSLEAEGDLVITMNSNATVFKTYQSIVAGDKQYYSNEELVVNSAHMLTWSLQAPSGTYNFYGFGYESANSANRLVEWATKVVIASDGSVKVTGLNPSLASTEVKGKYMVEDGSIVLTQDTIANAKKQKVSGYDNASSKVVAVKLFLSDDHSMLTTPYAIILTDSLNNRTSYIEAGEGEEHFTTSAEHPVTWKTTPQAAVRYVDLPFTVTTLQGLPGTAGTNNQYTFKSAKYHLNKATSKLRFTVRATNTGDNGDNGWPCFALAEFFIYDASGNALTLTADQFSTNAQETSEGPIANICDGDATTYFHSIWSSSVSSEYHYIEVTLPEPMDEFSFGWLSRNARTLPTNVVVGDDTYMSVGTTEIGDQVTSLSDIVSGQKYALFGNLNVVAGTATGSGYYSNFVPLPKTTAYSAITFTGDATNGYTLHFDESNFFVKKLDTWTNAARTTNETEAAKFTIAAVEGNVLPQPAFTLTYLNSYAKDGVTYNDQVFYLEDWGAGQGMALYPTGDCGNAADTDGEAFWYIYKVNSVTDATTTTGAGAFTTGISTITVNKPAGNNLIYDLSGRQVSKPVRGIYIQNGKKFVVK